MLKWWNAEEKEKSLKVGNEEKQITFKGKLIKLRADFLTVKWELDSSEISFKSWEKISINLELYL